MYQQKSLFILASLWGSGCLLGSVVGLWLIGCEFDSGSQLLLCETVYGFIAGNGGKICMIGGEFRVRGKEGRKEGGSYLTLGII